MHQLDGLALATYAGSVAFEVGAITATMAAAELLLLPSIGAFDRFDATKVVVVAFFLFTSIRSRVFSFLDAKRPTLASERSDIQARRRPSWQPPPVVFPIVWLAIAVLRTIACTLVWEASGRTLLAPALIAYFGHLSVGDTWNYVNNVQKRTGVAASGVVCVTAGAIATTALFFGVLPQAGWVLAPSCVWLVIASVLVISIWRINDPNGNALYPTFGMRSS